MSDDAQPSELHVATTSGMAPSHLVCFIAGFVAHNCKGHFLWTRSVWFSVERGVVRKKIPQLNEAVVDAKTSAPAVQTAPTGGR